MPDQIRYRVLVRKAAALAGGLTLAAGAAVLVAWWAGREDALRFFPDWPPIMANTALMFACCGLALALLAREHPPRAAARAARILALAPIAISLATAAEYLFGWDPGIDQLLARAAESHAVRFPGRPSPHTAAAFLLLGAALLTLDMRAGRKRPAPALAATAGALAIIAMLGHLFNGTQPYGQASLFPHNEMALLTAVLLLILSAGCIGARPDYGALATITSRNAGGIAARRLLAGLFAMAPLVGLLAIFARRGWYSAETAAAIIVFLGLVEAVTSVVRTARLLNQLAEAQERVMRLRDEVIGMTSHELRNPLTMALVSASALGDEAEALSPRGREILEMLERSIRRMTRLVDDFLDVEKLESGGAPLRLERVDLGPLLAETISGMAGAEGRVVMKSAEGLVVKGDRDRLTQVIINLVSNALKFSPAGARVEVEAAALDGRIRVSVRDRGPGIPAEFQGRIFERYARAEKSKASGSGLGLYISRMIVEKHGGRLGFLTHPGDGTTFYFELPSSVS